MIPTSDLRDQLQATLSGRYTIERELGGGMSRAFVAEETALGRRPLGLNGIPNNPYLTPLHSDPRYLALLKRIGLRP